MAVTTGMNHLGLSVGDLNETTRFFTECLGFEESGRDESYPRTSVTDGSVRLTLWQVTDAAQSAAFDRRKNIGLHHLAFSVATEADLNKLAGRIKNHPGVQIEFIPELVGEGPRKHLMCYEPGGLRVELIWSGES